MPYFLSNNAMSAASWSGVLTVLLLTAAMGVATWRPEPNQKAVRVELPEPIRAIGYISVGGAVTPRWALNVRLIATGPPVGIAEVFVEQNGVGRWTTGEVSQLTGVRASMTLHVDTVRDVQIEFISPNTGSSMPASFPGLRLLVRDHTQPPGTYHVVPLSDSLAPQPLPPASVLARMGATTRSACDHHRSPCADPSRIRPGPKAHARAKAGRSDPACRTGDTIGCAIAEAAVRAPGAGTVSCSNTCCASEYFRLRCAKYAVASPAPRWQLDWCCRVE
jgi:hypothetical protein